MLVRSQIKVGYTFFLNNLVTENFTLKKIIGTIGVRTTTPYIYNTMFLPKTVHRFLVVGANV
jgi:hypothetical protein